MHSLDIYAVTIDYRPLVCRVSALFYSDKVSMEPLTEHICMMDLLDSQPERMYHSARVIQALALGIEELHKFYTTVRLSAKHKAHVVVPDVA